MLKYLIALNDLHNFDMPMEKYRSLLRNEYCSFKIPVESLNIKTFGSSETFIDVKKLIDARSEIDSWHGKFFPKTRDENIEILGSYLTLCEEKQVRPIMFLPPMTEGYVKYFDKKMLDEFYFLVKESVKKHPLAIFVDGWKIKGFTNSDFRDVTHLNRNGALKFSALLNDMILKIDKIPLKQNIVVN